VSWEYILFLRWKTGREMLRVMCKSKIHRATVTATELDYEGSITIDGELLEQADILPGEKVEVYNLSNGLRFETYVIEGLAGLGEVCINGAAARMAQRGDKIIIASYVMLTEKETENWQPKILTVDNKNKLVG